MCRYEYLWQDEVRHKKAVQMTAPEYILTLLEWASDIITVDHMQQRWRRASIER